MNDKAIAVRRSELLPAATDLQTMLSMADTLVKGGLLPDSIKTPQAAFTVIQKGIELGIPPMAALNGIAVINGKPACSSELMGALIYRDHGDNAIDILETTNERCTVAFKRRGWANAKRYTFTIEDAKRAELTTGRNGHTWRKYPAAMLRARCLSAVARMAFQDSIGGMYTPEELGAEINEHGEILVLEHSEPSANEAPRVVEAEPEPIEADYRKADPEPKSARPTTSQAAATDDDPGANWNAFWRWARPRGYALRSQVEEITGLHGADATPSTLFAALRELESPTEPEPESPPATPADLDELDHWDEEAN